MTEVLAQRGWGAEARFLSNQIYRTVRCLQQLLGQTEPLAQQPLPDRHPHDLPEAPGKRPSGHQCPLSQGVKAVGPVQILSRPIQYLREVVDGGYIAHGLLDILSLPALPVR